MCIKRVRPAIGYPSSRKLTIFGRTPKSQQSTSTLLTMPGGKGKVNYKVDTLVMAVEELLPNGAQSSAGVAALYQLRSCELILQDHDNVKRYWIEKCCNKFKKPTGTPGDPKRDMTLRCQQIQERIHNKLASAKQTNSRIIRFN